MDTFLLHCLLTDSPQCDDEDRPRIVANMLAVVNRGREPGLMLDTPDGPREMDALARELLKAMAPVAAALDAAHGTDDYSAVLQLQEYKVNDPSLTPSAQILADMAEADLPFFALAMQASQRWAEGFRKQTLPAERLAEFRRESAASLDQQREVEAGDDVDFETYLANYYRQYDSL